MVFLSYLIQLSHSIQYFNTQGLCDDLYMSFRWHISQAVVVTFFFYSGYGMFHKYKNNGLDYVKRIPSQKIIKLYANMLIPVLLYISIDIFICGNKYTFLDVFELFIGYKCIRSYSNWYLFNIVVLYILFTFSFLAINRIKKKFYKDIIACVILFLLSITLVYIEIKIKQPSWFYNTLVFYSVGVWYGLLHTFVERVVMKSYLIWISILCVSFLIYYVSYIKRSNGIEWYTLWEMSFLIIILLVNMKVLVYSRVLEYMGKNILYIYLLQRIPMILFQHFGIAMNNRYFFVILSFVVTLLLVEIIRRINEIIMSRVFNK